MHRSSWLLSALAFFIFACSGGGSCGGCDDCAVQPIPGGFPPADRVDNATQVRLTPDGLDFIAANIDTILASALPEGLNFPFTEQSSEFLGGLVTVDFCNGGTTGNPCTIAIDLTSVTIEPVNGTNEMVATIVAELDAGGPSGSSTIPMDAGWAGSCQVDIDTTRSAGSRPDVTIVAELALESETESPRTGYTRIAFVEPTGGASNPEFAEAFESADLDLSACDGLIDILGGDGALEDFILDYLADTVNDQVGSMIQTALDGALCTTPGEYGCPTGTFAVGSGEDAICRFANHEDAPCVPLLLGTDAQGDLGGAFLGSFSPGTHAFGQLLMASGGDGESINEGLSLFLLGGYRSTDATFTMSPGHNTCVPETTPPELPTINRIDAFRANVVPATSDSFHFGAGLSEKMIDYGGWHVFDSGILCIGAGTQLSQQLSSGLFSFLVPSLYNLAFPHGSVAISIAVRPQQPPDFEVGSAEGEPLLSLTLPALVLDFYVWSSERYVRFMSFQADITVALNLNVGASASGATITPQIVSLTADNPVVSNTQLLTEDPAALAPIIEGVLEAFAGMLTGAIPEITLPDLMGFNLVDPVIMGVEDGGDEFLSVFANLALAGPEPTSAHTTNLRLANFTMDPRSLALETFGQGDPTTVELILSAEGGPADAEYEYSYRIDGMTWSPWTSEDRIVVDDRVLLLQANHVIEARSRLADEPAAVDPTPAREELLIDVLAPRVELQERVDRVELLTIDAVSRPDGLEYRFRADLGEWSEWSIVDLASPIALDDAGMELDVEVRDEAGNVSQAKLIRGLPDPNAGCDCAVPGRDGGLPLPVGFGLAGLVGMVLLARRRRLQFGKRLRSAAKSNRAIRSIFGGLLTFLLITSGCECGSSHMVPDLGDGSVRSDGDAAAPDPTALDPGMLATYLDTVAAPDGTIYLSGYSPGNPPGTYYGDLVVGVWDATTESVAWEIVDGVPDTAPTNNPAGWRNGISDPGDDVGRFTSIAETDGTLYVSYHDVTQGALKIAYGSPGSWTTETVDSGGVVGRYSSLVIDDGTVYVAYLAVLTPESVPGQPTSVVRVASASLTTLDWTITDVTSSSVACRPAFCPSGTSCLEDDEDASTTDGDYQCVLATNDCGECDEESICYQGACHPAVPDPFVEDLPPVVGLFTSLAITPEGLGLVYYDRTAGNLMGASSAGGTWGTPFLIDGYGYEDEGRAPGDSGISADLFVDGSGVWHVAYVDGTEEILRYAAISFSPEPTIAYSQVDEGRTDGSTVHEDGRHIVGDDATIVVTATGEIRIAYQDATVQTAVLATRAGGGDDFTIRVLDNENATGFWLNQVLVGNTSYIATFYRDETFNAKAYGTRLHAVE